MISKLSNSFLILSSFGIVTVWGLNDVTFFFILFSLILFVMNDQLALVGGTADSKTSRGGVSFSKQIAVLDSKRELLSQLLTIRLEGLLRVVSSTAYRAEVTTDRGVSKGSQFLEFSYKLIELCEVGLISRGVWDLKMTMRQFILFTKFYPDYMMFQEVKSKMGCLILKILDRRLGKFIYIRTFCGFNFASFDYAREYLYVGGKGKRRRN